MLVRSSMLVKCARAQAQDGSSVGAARLLPKCSSALKHAKVCLIVLVGSGSFDRTAK
jgi:hypothetical protein